MLGELRLSLEGLLPFLQYFGLALFLMSAFICAYVSITPHKEFALISDNNSAAAIAFVGALLGFALPLASAITHSLSLIDCALWSVIALVVQIATFYLLRICIKQVSERITRGELATGILVAASSVTIGIINAACMTY